MASKDNSDGFDWQRYEAEVVDLDAERARRDLDDQAATVPVDSAEAQRPAPVTLTGSSHTAESAFSSSPCTVGALCCTWNPA